VRPERTIVARLLAKPEKRDELLELLRGFVDQSRKEPGCVDYHLHVSDRDPNLFIFYENWRTAKELREHQKSSAVALFWPRRLEYLQKDVELEAITMLSEHHRIPILICQGSGGASDAVGIGAGHAPQALAVSSALWPSRLHNQ
jgi:quinol monooxygenase YgiN